VRKPIESFYKDDRQRKGGARPECIKCSKSLAKERRKKEPLALRSYDLRAKGCADSTKDRLRRLVKRSNNKCEACGREVILGGTKQLNSLVFDHCHASGLLRGVLCNGCNMALGSLEEDKDRIASLIIYLDTYGH
jgi:hypothetical protein